MQSTFPSLLVAPLLTACLLLSSCGGGGGSSSSSAEATNSPPAQTTSAPMEDATVNTDSADSTVSTDSTVSPDSTVSTDTQPPTIVSRTPADQTTEFSINALIEMEFNESLNPTTIEAQSVMVTQQAVPVAGTASYDNNTKRLIFTPDAALAPNTVYGVTVASTIEDMAGNLFFGDNWFFTTGGPYNLGLTTQSTIDQCMDDDDKLMLTLVNNIRATGTSCGTNELPVQPSLAWDCMLDQSSLIHSTAMADNDFHEHVSPVDGTDPGDRIRAAGYTPQAWAENIAAGYEDEDSVMAAWLTSPGHCANLMSSSFTQMGAADASNAASTFGKYWTQNFGRPLN